MSGERMDVLILISNMGRESFLCHLAKTLCGPLGDAVGTGGQEAGAWN